MFLVACSSSPTPPQEKFAKQAISITYVSSQKLNSYNNQAHTIPLVVYQLNDIDSFDGLKKDKDGIIKLLKAEKYDKSVMSVEKYYVSPNETKELLLDRAEKTAWVAIVAGYYDMQASQSTLQYQTPPYNALKLWSSEASQKFLTIKLYLDKSSIEQME